MPNQSHRTNPIALVATGFFYILAGAFVTSISAMSSMDRGTASLLGWLHQAFFSANDLLVLLAFWMGMRLGARDWRTWVVPVLLSILASIMTTFVAPLVVSIFATTARSSQLDLSTNTVLYLICYEGVPFVLTLWFAVSLVWLLSRAIGVVLVPGARSVLEENAIELESTRSLHWTLFCLNLAIMAAINFGLSLMGLIDYSRFLIVSSAILVWFGLAALSSYGFRTFSWSGVLCLAVGMLLPLSFWPWLFSRGGAPVGIIALVCVVAMVWSMFKWLLFRWALYACGYKLVASRKNAIVSKSQDENSMFQSVDETANESPIREWII